MGRDSKNVTLFLACFSGGIPSRRGILKPGTQRVPDLHKQGKQYPLWLTGFKSEYKKRHTASRERSPHPFL